MSLGICGGIDRGIDSGKKMKIGHLIVAEKVIYKGREIQLASSLFLEIVKFLEMFRFDFITGSIETFDCIVSSASVISENVVGVDMELYGIATQAVKYNKPVIAIKSVSDFMDLNSSVGKKEKLKEIRKNFSIAKNAIDVFLKKYFFYIESI